MYHFDSTGHRCECTSTSRSTSLTSTSTSTPAPSPSRLSGSCSSSLTASERQICRVGRKRKHHINQALAAFAVSFGPFAVGLSKGYTSPAIASMQSMSSNSSSLLSLTSRGLGHFSITEQQGSWIASLSLLGALFGGLCSGAVIQWGRKRALAFVNVPFSLCWLLITFANCVEMVYITAFLVGFFSAIIQLAAQVYISEIAHPSIRGSLCSASKVLSQIGLLASFALGAFLDWRQLACVCAGAPLMLFITARFIPETPSYLLYVNQEDKAERALLWLRGGELEDIQEELDTIHSNIRRKKDQGSDCRNVLVPQLIKPLTITCGLMFFHRFSGVAAFNFYAVSIFKESFIGTVNPHLAAVTTGMVQLLASVASGVLSDLIGRLPLLILSTTFMALALAGFGFFAYFNHVQNSVTSDLDWIPLACVLLFVCAFSLGLNPISWLLVGEIFPLEFRSLGPSLTTAFSYICAFVSVKTFVDLRQWAGLHGTFWTYSVVAMVGLIYSVLFVPETKGKTLDEMKHKSSILTLENARFDVKA